MLGFSTMTGGDESTASVKLCVAVLHAPVVSTV